MKLTDKRIAEIEAATLGELASGIRAELLTEREEREHRFSAPIVCICGSTKFKQAWITENAILTGQGNIVLAVGLWGHHERVYPDTETKIKLDDLHKRKIDLCDWVWVLDVDGYIGESTRSEIEYAEKLGRPIRYLSKEFPNYKEPVDLLESNNAQLHADNATLLSEREEFLLERKTADDVLVARAVAEDEASALRAEIERLEKTRAEIAADWIELRAELDEAQRHWDKSSREVAPLKEENATLRTRVESAEKKLEAVSENVKEGMALSEGEILREELGGNIVKKEFWKGEFSAYRQIRTLLDGKGE